MKRETALEIPAANVTEAKNYPAFLPMKLIELFGVVCFVLYFVKKEILYEFHLFAGLTRFLFRIAHE